MSDNFTILTVSVNLLQHFHMFLLFLHKPYEVEVAGGKYGGLLYCRESRNGTQFPIVFGPPPTIHGSLLDRIMILILVNFQSEETWLFERSWVRASWGCMLA
jgi:hypothetical protein